MADETTPLPPGREREFADWLRRNNVRDLDHPDSHYDYRGAFLAGVGRGARDAHFPDTFKQHGHPTFSVESKYSSGPGDGGHWNGDVYVPPVNEDPSAQGVASPPAPYGMVPGRRHVLPGISPIASPYQSSVKPDNITLDEDPAAAAPPVSQRPVTNGFRIYDKDGKNVLADLQLDPEKTRDYQGYQVMKIANSLEATAVTPEEKDAAAKAKAFMLARVGSGNIEDIKKDGVHMYDQSLHNGLSLQLQGMRSKANRGGVGGVPGPTKADKYNHTLDKDLMDRTDGIIKDQRNSEQYKKISEMDNDTAEMERLLSSNNAMSQRVAVQKQLLALTGKASRESEQAAITGAAGKWQELANKISLWTSSDPTLSAEYIREFKGMLSAQRAYINNQKSKIAKETAARIKMEARGYPEEDRTQAADIGYSTVSGDFGSDAYDPAQRGSAVSAPVVPKKVAQPGKSTVDEDLLK